jgi:hypothetical protein
MNEENTAALYSILGSYLNSQYTMCVDPATGEYTIAKRDGDDVIEIVDQMAAQRPRNDFNNQIGAMRLELSTQIDDEYKKIQKVITDMIDHKIDKIMIGVIEALKEKHIRAEIDRRVEERLKKIKDLL